MRSQAGVTRQWIRLGTHESLLAAAQLGETIEKRQGYKFACLEEIAFSNGWLGVEDLQCTGHAMEKNTYGQYLLDLAKGFK